MGVGINRICMWLDTYSHDVLARARLWRTGCNSGVRRRPAASTKSARQIVSASRCPPTPLRDLWLGGNVAAFRAREAAKWQVSFWQTVVAKSISLGGLLGASGSIGENVHGARSSFWHTIATKSMVLKRRGCSQEAQNVISADSCSEINGSRAREAAK